MKLAYSYVRFSSPEQAKGDSLRRQVSRAKEYCESNGLELADLRLHDLGKSAYKGEHVHSGALGAFIEAVKRGEVSKGSCLIVESLDRLSRETVLVALPRFLDIINLGIDIVTLQDKRRYSKETLRDGQELLISLIVMIRAHEESDVKSQRLRCAHEAKRKAARQSKKPTGYRPPDWMTKTSEGFELIEERVELVRRIFQLTIDGLGSIAIAKLLNSEQIPPWGRSKTGWQTTYIKKLLRTRTVLGEYQPHKSVNGKREKDGEPIFGYYPPIIDPQTFRKAELAIRSRDRRPVSFRKKAVNNILTGLVRCKNCGNTMHYVNKGRDTSKGGQYLVCSMARTGAVVNGKKCSYSSMRYQVIEDAVLHIASVVSLDLTPPDNSQELRDLKNKLAVAESRRAELESALESLLDNLEKVDANEFLFQRYNKRAQELKEQRQACTEIVKAIDVLEFKPKESHVFQKLSETLKKLKTEAADRENVVLRTRINSQLVSMLESIDIDGSNKLVSIHVDGTKTIDLRFDQRQKNYMVKPSWDEREFPPNTFNTKYISGQWSKLTQS
ncbi:TPA: recombinase family protein [Vibrio parahaemolyticus]|nr:recombinase family protein [Vibrio parahaemolyticus]